MVRSILAPTPGQAVPDVAAAAREQVAGRVKKPRIPQEVASAVNKLETASADIKRFMDDNEVVMTRFMDLVFAYNTAHTSAKTALGTLPSSDKSQRVGPFTIAAPSKKTVWHIEHLSDEDLRAPGVVKTLDAKVLKSMVVAGLLTDAVVDAVTGSEKGTASITGPKPIVIDL